MTHMAGSWRYIKLLRPLLKLERNRNGSAEVRHRRTRTDKKPTPGFQTAHGQILFIDHPLPNYTPQTEHQPEQSAPPMPSCPPAADPDEHVVRANPPMKFHAKNKNSLLVPGAALEREKNERDCRVVTPSVTPRNDRTRLSFPSRSRTGP